MQRYVHCKFLVVIQGLVAGLLCTLLVSHSCLAQTRTPHRTTFIATGLDKYVARTQSFGSTATASSLDREVITPVTIKAVIYGEGHVSISLGLKRNFTGPRSFTIDGKDLPDSTSVTFLQGRIALGGGLQKSDSPRVSATALSIINNKLRITFLGRPKGSKGRRRLYTIHAVVGDSSPSTAHVSSIPSHAGKSGACSTSVEDVDGHRHSSTEALSTADDEVTAQTLVSARVATLSTDADPEWYAKFGSESNAEILRVINTSEALFFRNFGITFRIVKQHTYTDMSPYSSTRADYLLSQFVRNPDNANNLGIAAATYDTDVDLKHLFTGKTIDGNILGIAYIGSLCATSHLAYGVSQAHLFDTTFGVFSHEISHSLGAFHDVGAPGTVMYPSISIPPSEIYSVRSLAEIRGFLRRSNICLSTEAVERPAGDTPGSIENPTTAPRALTLKKQTSKTTSTVRLSGTLTEGGAGAKAGITVNLILGNQIVASATTNSRGRYAFTVRTRLFSKGGSAVYSATEDWGATSKALSISAARARRS